MDVNLKKIKKQLLVLYYLLSDKNDIGPQRKQLFIQAINENISKSRKNNPLVVQLANELAGAMLIIEEQLQIIKDLEFEFYSPLRLMTDLEGISRYHENHYNLQKPLSVKPYVSTLIKKVEEINFNPKEVICIVSLDKDRKKKILEKKEFVDKPPQYNTYILDGQKLPNGQKLNFETLRIYLDPYRHNLVHVSRNALINEAYYSVEADFLNLEINSARIPSEFKKVELFKESSENNRVKEALIKCREDRRLYQISLQNIALRYKTLKSSIPTE
jgi:hypothetical protein